MLALVETSLNTEVGDYVMKFYKRLNRNKEPTALTRCSDTT